MTAVETVTIINKSGKIVSTGKHLVNIFKDAKTAYNVRKNELNDQKYLDENHKQDHLEVRTLVSEHSQRTRRSNHSKRHRHRESNEYSRPPLTVRNLSYVTESHTLRQSGHNSDHRSYRSTSPNQIFTRPSDTKSRRHNRPIYRRHTDAPDDTNTTALVSTVPPPYTSRILRSRSNPDFSKDSKIDMNLAYGHLPFDCRSEGTQEIPPEFELKKMIGKLNKLLLEARCLQYSATAIIAHLQKDPEAMAAVALTLAELSTIVNKMGPSVLRTLQTASPAIFALLASPQFLIATGLAMGATVVMFGGFHVVKRLQTNTMDMHEEKKLESAMTYSGIDIESIKSWRRGVAESEGFKLSSLVDEHYITPDATRDCRGRIKNRYLTYHTEDCSVYSENRSKASNNKSTRVRSVSEKSPSEISSSSRRTSVTTSTSKSSQGLDKMKKKKKEKKKPSLFSTLFEMKKQ